MSGSFILLTVFEILIAAVLIVGLFNEDSIVKFEEKAAKLIKSFLLSRRHNRKCRYKYYNTARKTNGHAHRRCA